MHIHVEEHDVQIPRRWVRERVIRHEDGEATVELSLHPWAGRAIVANAILRALVRALLHR